MRAVADGVVADLSRTLARATETDDPRTDLRTVATEYRAFVLQNPNGYRLLFADLPPGASPDPATVAGLGMPIVRAMTRLAGEDVALEGARTMVAWAHGFVSMELAERSASVATSRPPTPSGSSRSWRESAASATPASR